MYTRKLMISHNSKFHLRAYEFVQKLGDEYASLKHYSYVQFSGFNRDTSGEAIIKCMLAYFSFEYTWGKTINTKQITTKIILNQKTFWKLIQKKLAAVFSTFGGRIFAFGFWKLSVWTFKNGKMFERQYLEMDKEFKKSLWD